MSDQRPDRATGLIVHIDDSGDNEQLMKLLGMIRGVLRVIDVKKSCSMLVIFESEERTGQDEMGQAIRAAVEAVVGDRIMVGRRGPEVQWLENKPFGPASDARRAAWEELIAVSDRLWQADEDITDETTGDGATRLRYRSLLARQINAFAGKILTGE